MAYCIYKSLQEKDKSFYVFKNLNTKAVFPEVSVTFTKMIFVLELWFSAVTRC